MPRLVRPGENVLWVTIRVLFETILSEEEYLIAEDLDSFTGLMIPNRFLGVRYSQYRLRLTLHAAFSS